MRITNMLFVVSISLLVLNGCMSTRHVLGQSDADYEKASAGGRYSILQDHAPTGDIKVDHLPDLIPSWEQKSRGGNKSPYEVWGGHKTSNGETYDMYNFSAAHKSLPLPTYLKVTNLDNQRSVIVRVNDRGPFHGDRLIDLSYAAAARLDYHKKGLARVRVEAITPAQGASYNPEKTVLKTSSRPLEALPPKVLEVPPNEVSSTSSELVFSHLQLGAFGAEESADRLRKRLFEAFDTSVNVLINKQDDGLYKVLVGPFEDDFFEYEKTPGYFIPCILLCQRPCIFRSFINPNSATIVCEQLYFDGCLHGRYIG